MLRLATLTRLRVVWLWCLFFRLWLLWLRCVVLLARGVGDFEAVGEYAFFALDGDVVGSQEAGQSVAAFLTVNSEGPDTVLVGLYLFEEGLYLTAILLGHRVAELLVWLQTGHDKSDTLVLLHEVTRGNFLRRNLQTVLSSLLLRLATLTRLRVVWLRCAHVFAVSDHRERERCVEGLTGFVLHRERVCTHELRVGHLVSTFYLCVEGATIL